MNFHILTLFPEMVMQGLMTSITGRAVKQNKISIEAVNIRDYTTDKHRKVDDYPYGGGAGMLMQAQPVFAACESVLKNLSGKKKRVVYVTPQGRLFNQQMARKLAENDDLVILCGHYEGIDERALEEVVTDYISIGDYVLTGGELAAMVIVDTVARLVPGVLGNGQSAETESFHGNLLEYPQYSRPEIWHGRQVPPVLLSGNAKEVAAWQKEASLKRTKERRPDLYRRYCALFGCKELLLRQKLNHIDMIELIGRGRARLVWQYENEILLKDLESGNFYHTNLNAEEKQPACDFGALIKKNEKIRITVHQQPVSDFLQEKFGFTLVTRRLQYAYTRREKLPAKIYKGYDIRPGQDAVFSCFVEEKLAGSIGIQKDGSMGMPYVFPGYRENTAMALEAYLVNYMLDYGMVPYIQVEEENHAALMLQEKLGLCAGKSPVFFLCGPTQDRTG